MSERYEVRDCPVCGRKPLIEQCAPWPSWRGKAPWAAGCYRNMPFEHFVGVNGDTEPEARRLWNAEADKIAALSHPNGTARE